MTTNPGGAYAAPPSLGWNAVAGSHRQREVERTMPPALCLLADDLTGALDSAAWFASLAAPVQVVWQSRLYSGAIAVDAGTREMAAAAAGQQVATLVAAFPPAPGGCHFLKLDSLLRGHAATEIAAWHAVRPFDHCVLAPAFPRQGRVTRGGGQYWHDGAAWVPTACDLVRAVETAGFAPTLCHPGEAAPDGMSLWDAETDDDLRAIVAAGRGLAGEVLWCGCGGLAGALADTLTGRHQPLLDALLPDASPWFVPVARPVLGLFGTDHPVTVRQIAACDARLLVSADGTAEAVARVAARLRTAGLALVRPALPDGLSRREAAQRIDMLFADLIARLAPPATLVVSGGETLRAVCRALGADHLDLIGQIVPGIPLSILRGGLWDGVGVVSKSGAFGTPDTLAQLFANVPPPAEGSDS
ncbi:MAG: four-carbon acid sugar kinase family protein [Rhodopila sp.]|nr:four-carbon acid sugar kinase family protein [Rhodopila sp.]